MALKGSFTVTVTKTGADKSHANYSILHPDGTPLQAGDIPAGKTVNVKFSEIRNAFLVEDGSAVMVRGETLDIKVTPRQARAPWRPETKGARYKRLRGKS